MLGCGGCRYRCVSLCWWLSEEYRGADVAEMGVCPDPYDLNRVVPARDVTNGARARLLCADGWCLAVCFVEREGIWRV